MSPALHGHGVGLRPRHFARFLEETPRVDFVEAITENFFSPGGRPRAVLERVRRDLPVALHGVSLSIGGPDPLSAPYLDRVAELVRWIEPAVVSDHLCWGTHGGRWVHDLWPLPYTEEALRHVVARIAAVQERLGRRILLENVSSYVAFQGSTMPEWEFVAEVARRADCGILLDVNNVWVSARNHGFDPDAYVAGLPVDRVWQLHLAGHTDHGAYLLDSHDEPVPPAVWALYGTVLRRFGEVPSLVEWDDRIPELEVLLAQRDEAAARAAALRRDASARHPGAPAASKDGLAPSPPREVTVRPPETVATLQAAFHALATGTAGAPRAAEDFLVGTPALGAAERVGIYAGMYLARQLDALREEFPATAGVLGEGAFAALARAYVAAHPSEHPDLGQLGRRLAAFLADRARDAPRPDLGALAALEWARSEVFLEAEAAPIGAEAVAAVPPAALGAARLRLVPALRLLRLDPDPTGLWRAWSAGAALPPPATGPVAVAAWRAGWEVFHAALPADEAEALGLALTGAPLAEVCAAFAGREAPARAAFEALASWVAEGWVAGVDGPGFTRREPDRPGEPSRR